MKIQGRQRDIGYEQHNKRIRHKKITQLNQLVTADWHNDLVQAAAQRYLHVLIESVIGFARYCVHQRFNEKVHQAREAFDVLQERNIISKQELQRINAIIGFRNVLVHDYMDINEALVKEIVLKKEYLFLQDLAEKL